MKRVVMIACSIALCAVMSVAPSKNADSSSQAKEVLARCAAAMGGADRLRSVETISYQSFEHTFIHAVDISDSLPGFVAYSRDDIVLQPRLQKLGAKVTSWTTESPQQNTSAVTASPEGGFTEAGDKKTPFNGGALYGVIDTLAANPISALVAALGSPDLALVQQPSGTYAVSFNQTIYGQQVKTTLGINGSNSLLEWLEIQHSYKEDIFSSIWGDTTKRFTFSAWHIDPSGVYFPSKWKVVANGFVEGQQSLFNVKLNPEVPASTFDIPQEFKGSYEKILSRPAADLAKANHGDGDHVDIAEGVMMLPGKQYTYNSLIVKQDKGVVIIEGPFSNANSEYVIDYAHEHLPNTPIAAVVSTNQLWFHVAGLAAYSESHTPIYVLDSNADLVRNIVRAQEDADHVQALAPQLRTVRDKTGVGTGANRIVLIPFRGEESARSLAVYFPELKLLYCSDLYLPQNWGGAHWTEGLAEIRDLIDREHIDVQRVAGVSMPPHDWKDLFASIPPVSADSLQHKSP